MSGRGFDGRGNSTLGLKDQLLFPEIDYMKVDKARGMNVSVVTTALTEMRDYRLDTEVWRGPSPRDIPDFGSRLPFDVGAPQHLQEFHDDVESFERNLQQDELRLEDLARIRESFGLNQPIPVQYAKWATGMLTGDWGRSYRDSRPVRDVILDRVPATLELTVTALAFAVIVGVAIGAAVSSAFGGGGRPPHRPRGPFLPPSWVGRPRTKPGARLGA